MLLRRFLALTMLAAIAGCAVSQSGSALRSGSELASASAASAGLPASGPVVPGTYHVATSAWSVAGYTVTLPDGWETRFGVPGGKRVGEPGELYFYFVVVDAIYSDPCHGEGKLITVGPSVDDLVNALLEQPVVVADGPVDTTLGGLPAKRIDLSVPDDVDTAGCRMGEELQIWYSPPADKYFVLVGDGKASVYVLDVDGERQVFLTQYRAGATLDDVTEMGTIVESIEIDP
jgi:hypothetical protein